MSNDPTPTSSGRHRERIVLLTLRCAGTKAHVLARVVNEDGSLYIEAPHTQGGYWPKAANASGDRVGVIKGTPGRYELHSGEAAQRSATRFACSCTNVFVSDVVLVEAIDSGSTKLVSDQVPQASFSLGGQDFTGEILRLVLSDSPSDGGAEADKSGLN